MSNPPSSRHCCHQRPSPSSRRARRSRQMKSGHCQVIEYHAGTFIQWMIRALAKAGQRQDPRAGADRTRPFSGGVRRIRGGLPAGRQRGGHSSSIRKRTHHRRGPISASGPTRSGACGPTAGRCRGQPLPRRRGMIPASPGPAGGHRAPGTPPPYRAPDRRGPAGRDRSVRRPRPHWYRLPVTTGPTPRSAKRSWTPGAAAGRRPGGGVSRLPAGVPPRRLRRAASGGDGCHSAGPRRVRLRRAPGRQPADARRRRSAARRLGRRAGPRPDFNRQDRGRPAALGPGGRDRCRTGGPAGLGCFGATRSPPCRP
jgi:hypothetical protein